MSYQGLEQFVKSLSEEEYKILIDIIYNIAIDKLKAKSEDGPIIEIPLDMS